MALVFIMLCSGLFHFTLSSNRLRWFNVSDLGYDWDNASQECKKTNTSLVTLYDDEDAKFIKKFVDQDRSYWLGLRKGRTQTWSDGVNVTYNKSSANVTNGEQRCEAIVINKWKDFSCSDTKYFMCNNGNSYTLIKKKKNWCEALHYCRKHFTDLVSISDIKQNNEVIAQGKNTSFWIGLLHDEWQWEDNGCSSYREWGVDLQKRDSECTACLLSGKQTLYKHGCTNEIYNLFSRGTMRIRVIENPLTWEQAFDYCRAYHTGLLWIENVEDQMSVSQWLRYTTTEDAGPFWIGLRQSRVFGFWIWSSDMTVNYSNWKDKVPELPLSNHCGVINKHLDYKWSDENCLVELHFICEEEIVFMNK